MPPEAAPTTDSTDPTIADQADGIEIFMLPIDEDLTEATVELVKRNLFIH